MTQSYSHIPLKDQVTQLKKEVHRLRQASQELLESRRMLSALMNNLPGIVYRCANDENWTMEFVSHGTYDLLGFGPEKLEGDPLVSFMELIHPKDKQKNLPVIDIKKLIARGKMRDTNPYRLGCGWGLKNMTGPAMCGNCVMCLSGTWS